MRIFNFVFIVVSAVFAENLADGLVAVVGNSPITQSEVLQGAQMQLIQSSRTGFSSEQELDYYFEKSLESIISQKVLFEHAQLDTEIVVSNDDIDLYIENHVQTLIDQHGSLEALERLLGQSISSFKKESWGDVYRLMISERYQQKLLSAVSVSRKEVVAFFELNKDSLGIMPARTKYSIIEIPGVPGPAAEAETVEFLRTVRDSILNGGDFSDFAKKYSQDPGTAALGGDLGYVQRGTLVPEYEMVGFSLVPGEISLPIKTEFGYHLIKLLDRQGEKIHTKHILRILDASESDRKMALDSLKFIYSLIETNPQIFDSVALNLRAVDNNISSVYDWTFNSNIPEKFLTIINELDIGEISSPFETEEGFAFIMVYNKLESIKPDLDNSWKIISDMALQDKLFLTMNRWLDVAKKEIYIKYYY